MLTLAHFTHHETFTAAGHRAPAGTIMPLPSFASESSVEMHSKIVQLTLELQQVQAETDDNNARADAMQEHAKHVVQEIDAAQAQVGSYSISIANTAHNRQSKCISTHHHVYIPP